MEDAAVLIDSSVWIRSLRRGGPAELKAAVSWAIGAGIVATCPVVNMELLVGARDASEFDALLDSTRGLPEVAITGRVWEGASRLGYSMRRQGHPLPLTDLVIAQCAISSQRVLWHADSHFEQIRRFTELRTRPWNIG